MLEDQNCKTHKSPIILVDEQKKPLCIVCLRMQIGYAKLISQFNLEQQQNKQKLINKQINFASQFLETLDKIKQNVEIFKSDVMKSLDRILQAIAEQIKQISIQQDKNIAVIKEYDIFKLDELISVFKKQNQESINNSTIMLQNLLKEINLNKIQDQITQDMQNIKMFLGYYLIEYQVSLNSVLENTKCSSFTFNKQNTILFVGCDSEIIVQQFDKGMIKQVLQENSSELISISADKSIIIWMQQNNSWSSQKQLQGHQDCIITQTITKDESLLVTGGQDQKIKFWQKISGNWQFLQDLNQNYLADQISFNKSNKQLVCCGRENFLLIIEKKSQWEVTQTIDVKENGAGIIFVNEDEFVYQPKFNAVLQVYRQNPKDNLFTLINSIELNSCKEVQIQFSIQYIESKNLIVVKHGKLIYLISKFDKFYTVEQSIDINSEIYFGCINNIGNYLIVWDQDTKKIQVITLKYL